MTQRKVSIEYNGQVHEVFVPEEVTTAKIDNWIELWKLEQEYESLPKSVETSCGRTITIPSRGFALAVQTMSIPEEEKKELNELRSKKSSIMQKIMCLRKKVYGHAKAEKRNKLLDENGTYILELAGRDYTSSEIHRILCKEGKELEYQEVLTFVKRNEDKIRELRNKFREDYTDLSLTVKRSRLEKLNLILNELMVDFDNTKSVTVKTSLSREIRSIIDQARKEVEGEEIKLTVSGRIDIEATINQFVNDSKILQGLTIHQLVISRVAARLGLSSQYLIDRLAHGYYSKFNGYRKNADLSTKPIYPSEVKYDILDLEQKNKRLEQEKKKYEIEDVQYQEVKKEPKKDLLKQLLLSRQTDNKEVKRNIQGNK